jgi:hypothetical protein
MPGSSASVAAVAAPQPPAQRRPGAIIASTAAVVAPTYPKRLAAFGHRRADMAPALDQTCRMGTGEG